MKLIASDDVKELTSYFRKLLSGEMNDCVPFLNLMMLWLLGSDPPIQQVIDCGVVPCLIRFLQMDDSPDIQLEAARAVTYITFAYTSDHLRHVIDAGGVPILIRLLSSIRM